MCDFFALLKYYIHLRVEHIRPTANTKANLNKYREKVTKKS